MNNNKEAKMMTIEQIKARNKIYMFVLTVISIAEAAMIIRSIIGAIEHNGFDTIHGVYFGAYISLFVFSLITLILLLINQKTQKLYDKLVIVLNVYCAILIAWATTISFTDVFSGGSTLVYLTIIVFVAALAPMIPSLFCILTSISTIGLIITLFNHGEEVFKSSGTIINISVFAIFSIILSFSHYHLELEAFKSRTVLEKYSYFDQLTGAYNRRSLKKYTESLPKGAVFYFGIVDVDNFKDINDTFGHDVGDKCLVDIADCLKDAFGKTIYRYGGDEFAIICEHRKNDIINDFNQVNAKLKEKYPELDIHISAGFYQPLSSNEQYFEYFKKADKALYSAKNTGKRKIVFFSGETKSV